MLDRIISIIAPHNCVSCQSEGSLLCPTCASRLRAAVPRCYKCQRPAKSWQTCKDCQPDSCLNEVRSAVRYNQTAVKQLLWRLKFDRAQAAAQDIARAMVANAPKGRYLVVPAPTAAVRTRQRGYDQACLIAKALVKQFPDRYQYSPVLARLGTKRQLGTSRQQRSSQLVDAFRLKHPIPSDIPILLIDDVVTTGATLQAAAAVLGQGGARRIEALVFAQA